MIVWRLKKSTIHMTKEEERKSNSLHELLWTLVVFSIQKWKVPITDEKTMARWISFWRPTLWLDSWTNNKSIPTNLWWRIASKFAFPPRIFGRVAHGVRSLGARMTSISSLCWEGSMFIPVVYQQFHVWEPLPRVSEYNQNRLRPVAVILITCSKYARYVANRPRRGTWRYF